MNAFRWDDAEDVEMDLLLWKCAQVQAMSQVRLRVLLDNGAPVTSQALLATKRKRKSEIPDEDEVLALI